MVHRYGTLALGWAFVATALAGCAEPSDAGRNQDRTPPPHNVIEKMVGAPMAWHGSVGSLNIQQLNGWFNIGCRVGDVCLANDNEYRDWVWAEGINKILINLTWTPTSDGSERLALSIRMWDFANWQEPEQEIRYQEGRAPTIQMKLEGDVVRKEFTIRVELPQDSDFVMKQEFDLEITKWNNQG